MLEPRVAFNTALVSVNAFSSNENKSTETGREVVLPHPSTDSLLVPTWLGHALRVIASNYSEVSEHSLRETKVQAAWKNYYYYLKYTIHLVNTKAFACKFSHIVVVNLRTFTETYWTLLHF